MPAASNAADSCGRPALSHRGDEVVSGRITPTLPAAWPPPLLSLPPPPPPLSSLPPHAATPSARVTARAVMRVRRRAIRRVRSVGDVEQAARDRPPPGL